MGGDCQVLLIDFEYSEYSFLAFDIGNHWNEWSGFDCDWEVFPGPDQQARFISQYLNAACTPGSGYMTGRADCAANGRADAVAKLVAEANVFSMVSHLYWGTWAVVQSVYSDKACSGESCGENEFDYLAYSKRRLSRLAEVQQAVLAEHLPVAAGGPDHDL